VSLRGAKPFVEGCRKGVELFFMACDQFYDVDISEHSWCAGAELMEWGSLRLEIK
jgi:hypothetical protein